MAKINKALIAAAGFGTRMLPITKTIQKEMLPILNRPVIDYVVDDCIEAGIEEIIFVVNDRNSQIENYYSENSSLGSFLRNRGKYDSYKALKYLHDKANFRFLVQSPDELYGTATPVRLARKLLVDEDAFLYLTGDDILVSAGHGPWIHELTKTFHDTGAIASATVVPIPKEKVSSYGVCKIKSENGFDYLIGFVEKPLVDEAPSNLINVSKYVFTPRVFEILDDQKPNPKSNELFITDTLIELTKRGKVAIYQFDGNYLDTGSPQNWLEANRYFADLEANTPGSSRS